MKGQAGMNGTPRISMCPSCEQSDVATFFTIGDAPVHSVFNCATPEQAREIPRGRLELAVCGSCGFITNRTFDESRLHYGSGYESTQAFSETFNAFARELVDRLVSRYDLRGRHVVEIGCGNGEFLHLLCTAGGNRATGYDPAYDESRSPCAGQPGITIIRDFFGKSSGPIDADFVYCRMTLEHIHEVGRFVRTVRSSLRSPDTRVFFQVPNAYRILQDCAFEDVYYEHCSYFTAGSLARLFESAGFKLLDVETGFDDQYVLLAAQPDTVHVSDRAAAAPDDRDETVALASSFDARFGQKRALWRERLARVVRDGRHGVLWGGGSKAVSFMTSIEPGDAVQCAVDINPHRQRTFLAGSGIRIVDPEFLKTLKPGVVIIMNRVYAGEIARQLAAMSVETKLLTLEEGSRADAEAGRLNFGTCDNRGRPQ